jgi:hypothetical protein
MRSLDLKERCAKWAKTILLNHCHPSAHLQVLFFTGHSSLGFSSKSAVINPMSDFALSVVGGWVGTNVFTLLLK